MTRSCSSTAIAASPTTTRASYDRAIQDFDEALRRNPSYARNGYINRGDAYRKKGDRERRERRL